MLRHVQTRRALSLAIIVSFLVFSVATAFSQSGSIPPASSDPRASDPALLAPSEPVQAVQQPLPGTTPSPSPAPQPAAQVAPISAPASPQQAPAPVPSVTATSVPTTTVEVVPFVQETPEPQTTAASGNSVNIPFVSAIAAAAALAVGAVFYMLRMKKKKPEKKEKDDTGCLDLKKRMEKKLEELTDLRGQLTDKVKSKAREKVRNAVAGTATGTLLSHAEHLEKEYARLKMLYEQCIAGVSRKKRVFIIHGWDGYPEAGWFPWLKGKLEAQGFNVIVPQMPEPGTPRIETWIPAIEKIVGTADERTYFVGHSMGCQAIARYLEGLPDGQKIGGAVFVAGFFKRLTNLEDDDEVRDVAREWLETPIDLSKVRTHLSKGTAIFSDNDPYVPLDNQDDFKKALGCNIVIEHAKGHFSGSLDKMTELPIVLEWFLK